jgi:glycosyltransferase involved in cell wall biosynthesis
VGDPVAPLRIVVLCEQFSEGMGYAENLLPKALAALGHDVHVVSSNAQVYADDPFYADVYGRFLGQAYVDCGVKMVDGFHLHRHRLRRIWRRLRHIDGLARHLGALRPHVVQSFASITLTTVEAALYSMRYGYKFFTGNHTVASVYPAARHFAEMPWPSRLRIRLADTAPGFVAASRITTCYAATVDAADIAVRFFGVPPAKVKLQPLGVDTDRFAPASGPAADGARVARRRSIGVANDELLCIYTGRFTVDKGPLVLAQAVERLVDEGIPARALFIGHGPQGDEIAKCRGALVREFMPSSELPDWYRAADVGVWPRQESISMLDAAACGLPIVISDRVQARERVDGNGLTYVEESVPDMMHVLKQLADPALRDRLGRAGAQKILEQFSWMAIARQRVADYEAALNR